VASLNKVLNQALNDESVQKQLHLLGATAQPMSAEQFWTFLLQEDAKGNELVKQGVLRLSEANKLRTLESATHAFQ
jgi:tripartite-type tricarboxylate transporter receptor subunit TctC